MCFPEPDMKVPDMPVNEGAEETKSGVFKKAKKRRGYQSTILTDSGLGGASAQIGASAKRLLGE